MTKLFTTLYLMVFASFALFLGFGMALDKLGDTIISNSNIEKNLSIGVFHLLDNSLKKITAQNNTQQKKQELIKEYRAIFGPEFDLIDITSIKLNREEAESLDKGEIIIVEKEILENPKTGDNSLELLYKKHLDSSLVWKIDFDTSASITIDNLNTSTLIHGGRFFDGMFYLLEKELSIYPQSQWSKEIEKLETLFSLPISIMAKDTAIHKLKNGNDFQALLKNQVINITQGSKNATFIRQIPHQENLLLQIGPIEIPWFIRNTLYMLFLGLALSIATALLFWLWPLWSNLLKIKKAADAFGAGNYDTRIKTNKRSSISNISNAFNSMAQRTQMSIHSQKELTSAVSHELRTPVARMRFALEMLENTSEKEDKQRFFKSLNQDIDELDLLLEELLSYARFDQENNQISPYLEKLVPWITKSIERISPLVKNKKLTHTTTHIDNSETALFEARLMSRVLDNLCQNALRYAKTTVHVNLSKDKNNYLLTVDDDGCGIPKEDQEKIFDAFSRLDASRDRASGGFGLGLAIANRIVTAHQGRIDVCDSKLGGACFKVSWPIKKHPI